MGLSMAEYMIHASYVSISWAALGGHKILTKTTSDQEEDGDEMAVLSPDFTELTVQELLFCGQGLGGISRQGFYGIYMHLRRSTVS